MNILRGEPQRRGTAPGVSPLTDQAPNLTPGEVLEKNSIMNHYMREIEDVNEAVNQIYPVWGATVAGAKPQKRPRK
jgi:hypothetical protein